MNVKEYNIFVIKPVSNGYLVEADVDSKQTHYVTTYVEALAILSERVAQLSLREAEKLSESKELSHAAE